MELMHYFRLCPIKSLLHNFQFYIHNLEHRNYLTVVTIGVVPLRLPSHVVLLYTHEYHKMKTIKVLQTFSSRYGHKYECILLFFLAFSHINVYHCFKQCKTFSSYFHIVIVTLLMQLFMLTYINMYVPNCNISFLKLLRLCLLPMMLRPHDLSNKNSDFSFSLSHTPLPTVT